MSFWRLRLHLRMHPPTTFIISGNAPVSGYNTTPLL
jgi:hypothetical protein